MIGDYDHNYEHAADADAPYTGDGSEFISNKPKKQIRKPITREVNKKLHHKGQEYRSAHRINGGFKQFHAHLRRDEDCIHKCKDKLSEENKIWLYETYRKLDTHESQNSYLRGLTHIQGHNCKGKKYKHYLQPPGRPVVEVCQKYFVGLFGLKSRGSLLCKVLNQNNPINDGRGHHNNHPRIDVKILAVIRRFFGTFPKRSSHYSGEDNYNKEYLDSHLTVAELLRIFKVIYPEYEERVKYDYFNQKFNYEFNLSFGLPRSDVCEICDRIRAEIISNRLSNNSEKARQLDQEIKNHWKEAEAFYNKLKQARENDDDTVLALCIDYEKQQPLPKTNVGQEYFKSQLSIQTFCVEDIKTGEATFFVYPENYAKKGSSEVISFLDNFIAGLPPTKRQLLLFCDNCGGQNKNISLFGYFQYLVDTGRFDSIYLYFPIPGHSRLPCDRLFGVLQKFIKRQAKIINPSDYITCIKKAIISKPVTIKYANFHFTDNLKSDGNEVVIVNDYKTQLKQILNLPAGRIQRARVVHFRKDQVTKASDTEQEIEFENLNLLKPGKTVEDLKSAILNAPRKNESYIKIARTKFDNIRDLLQTQFISTGVKFFESLEPMIENVQTNEEPQPKTVKKKGLRKKEVNARSAVLKETCSTLKTSLVNSNENSLQLRSSNASAPVRTNSTINYPPAPTFSSRDFQLRPNAPFNRRNADIQQIDSTNLSVPVQTNNVLNHPQQPTTSAVNFELRPKAPFNRSNLDIQQYSTNVSVPVQAHNVVNHSQQPSTSSSVNFQLRPNAPFNRRNADIQQIDSTNLSVPVQTNNVLNHPQQPTTSAVNFELRPKAPFNRSNVDIQQYSTNVSVPVQAHNVVNHSQQPTTSSSVNFQLRPKAPYNRNNGDIQRFNSSNVSFPVQENNVVNHPQHLTTSSSVNFHLRPQAVFRFNPSQTNVSTMSNQNLRQSFNFAVPNARIQRPQWYNQLSHPIPQRNHPYVRPPQPQCPSNTNTTRQQQ